MFERFCSPHGDMLAEYDSVVVGSGYGGAVAAARLAEAGRGSVCVLEYGKEWLAGEFPFSVFHLQDFLSLNTPTTKYGQTSALMNIVVSPAINIARARGLGGGSLINCGVTIRPKDNFFESSAWPQELQLSSKAGELESYFQRAEEMLSASPLSRYKPTPAKTKAMRDATRANGWLDKFKLVPLALRFDNSELPCTDYRGDEVTGNNTGCKLTLRSNYLGLARRHGAHFFCNIEVRAIQKASDGKWLVRCKDILSTMDMFVRASNVVLAAGCVGTSEILLRSAQLHGLSLSSHIGHRVSSNGEVFAHVVSASVNVSSHPKPSPGPVRSRDYQEAYDAPGPSITSMVDLRSEKVPVVIEDCNTLPYMWRAAVVSLPWPDSFWSLPSSLWRWTSALLSLRVCSTMAFVGMGYDGSSGQINLNDHDRIDVVYRSDEIGDRTRQKLLESMRLLAEAMGGRLVTNNSIMQFLHFLCNGISQSRSSPIAVAHPLGGATMGNSALDGVVDHQGRVFTNSNEHNRSEVYEGLLITDGSVLPMSIGINPLLTITMLAERTMELHLSKQQQKEANRW